MSGCVSVCVNTCVHTYSDMCKLSHSSIHTHTHTHIHNVVSDFIARHGHHSQQMEDFLREAKEMSKVEHFRVVKLIAVCTR